MIKKLQCENVNKKTFNNDTLFGVWLSWKMKVWFIAFLNFYSVTKLCPPVGWENRIGHITNTKIKRNLFLFGFLNFWLCINYQYEDSRCKECLFVQNIIRLLIKTTADIHAQHWPYWWKNSGFLSLSQTRYLFLILKIFRKKNCLCSWFMYC